MHKNKAFHLKDAARAALKIRLRLSAPTDKKLGSGTGSGAALKMAGPGGSYSAILNIRTTKITKYTGTIINIKMCLKTRAGYG